PWSSAGSYFCDDGVPIQLGGAMQIPQADQKKRDSSNFVAAEDAGRLSEEASELLERAVGVEWYRQHGTDVDRATAVLCRLRRAKAGERGGPEPGDPAVPAAPTPPTPTPPLSLPTPP